MILITVTYLVVEYVVLFIDAIYLFASFMILLLVYVNSCDVSVITISFEVI